MKANKKNLDTEFYTRYRGSFSGILKWPQLDELWQVLTHKADAGWYIYAIGELLPEQSVPAEKLIIFIEEINKLLKKEHKEDYCGVVYVDDKNDPAFIKIYDPNNLGVVCGFSDNPPVPGWILTLIKPELLDENTFITQSRQRWWQRIFSA
ncbi:hypothetical protein MNBD_GAMMA21-662 [hydrothermal vent metagenome]|uniref:Uncharacterized protein n=1 Tax=hydrothermal vent metagenome TaxID=652676 RepID=A0A3B1B5J1_9ZZZZ